MGEKVSKATKCYPYNVSDVNLRDTDSNMRLYRGMSSPWQAIKSFQETFDFHSRTGAAFCVAAIHALRIVVPDYDERETMLSDNWSMFMDYVWSPAAGQIEPFEDRFDIPPFLKVGPLRAAVYADKGDTQQMISGKLWYTTNDRFEKEVHRCDYDIAGPEVCDLSVGGGTHFCRGIAGCPLNSIDPERIGNGDDYCLAINETKKKYGKHPNSNENDGWDEEHREWAGWGPSAGGQREKGWDHFPHPQFIDTGYFEAATGARWTAGELYQDNVGSVPIAYVNNAIDLYRNKFTPEQKALWDIVVPAVFEACGKFEFADFHTRKATREWMNVPSDVNDSRVMGAWISMVFQARNVDCNFLKFESEETIIEGDLFKWNMLGMYPELNGMYKHIFNGNVRTLVGAKWNVDYEEDFENQKIRYIIHRGPIGPRKQKPHLGPNNFDDAQN